MASKDLELLREAYAITDVERFGEHLHPDAELHQAQEIPDSETYRGRNEFVRGLRVWLEGWDRFRYEPVEFLEGPNRIFMRIKLIGRGKGSGVKIEQEVFNVWEMRDGLPWRCEVYWSEAPARRSAGV